MPVASYNLVSALVGLALVLAYYLFVWFLVGRDPAAGPVIPLFSPPRGFSPAAVRYLSRGCVDYTAFAAAVLSMAVKGYLKIEEHDGQFTLRRTGRNDADLSTGEKALAAQLFSLTDWIVLNESFQGKIDLSLTVLEESLRAEYEEACFVTNRGFFAPGLLISLLAVVTVAAGATHPVIDPPTAAVLAATLLLNPLFYWLLQAPTWACRRVLDQIEGFKLYLSLAERERLGVLYPPEKTPALFEKYLPYAVALDAAHTWGEQFAGILTRAGTAREEDYSPEWLAGSLKASHLTSLCELLLGAPLSSTPGFS